MSESTRGDGQGLQDARSRELCRKRNQLLQSVIARTKIDDSAAYDLDFCHKIVSNIAQTCDRVMDFGKSTRDNFQLFSPGQAVTADIVEYSDYPDHFTDICDRSTYPTELFDAIIFLAVLEHVYDPKLAVENVLGALKPGGIAFCYAPFLYRYHAPADLYYQDYFRFSADGLAYLFRDFSEVTLYPVRGRVSSAANLFGFWKSIVEDRLGTGLNRFLDKMASYQANTRQASGYFVYAVR